METLRLELGLRRPEAKAQPLSRHHLGHPKRSWRHTENSYKTGSISMWVEARLRSYFLNGVISSLFFVLLIQLTVYKNCWWLDLNCRPLELEATALPTELQPLPNIKIYVWINFLDSLSDGPNEMRPSWVPYMIHPLKWFRHIWEAVWPEKIAKFL